MRRIARTQQRKRQTWLALPASGIEEVGHGQECSGTIGQGFAEAAGGRREGIADKVRPGIEQAMERIRLRGQVPIISEVLQIAIMKMDLMSDDELIEFLCYPRHEILISENVARDFHNRSLIEIRRDSGDQIIEPQ